MGKGPLGRILIPQEHMAGSIWIENKKREETKEEKNRQWRKKEEQQKHIKEQRLTPSASSDLRTRAED